MSGVQVSQRAPVDGPQPHVIKMGTNRQILRLALLISVVLGDAMWQPVSDQSNAYAGELLWDCAPHNTVSSNLTCYTISP